MLQHRVIYTLHLECFIKLEIWCFVSNTEIALFLASQVTFMKTAFDTWGYFRASKMLLKKRNSIQKLILTAAMVKLQIKSQNNNVSEKSVSEALI